MNSLLMTSEVYRQRFFLYQSYCQATISSNVSRDVTAKQGASSKQEYSQYYVLVFQPNLSSLQDNVNLSHQS